MNFVKTFVEDMEYYDPRNKELGEIIGNIGKNDIVVDIGAGSGRLSIPISKIAKRVIAVESDKRLADYLKKHKRKNIEVINENAEAYLKNKKFDIILLAWPTIEFKWIKLIKESMDGNSLFVFTTCDSNSDFETIIDKIGVMEKEHFKDDIKNKAKFIKQLPVEFKLIKNKLIETTVEFPDEKTAFRIIRNSLGLWFGVKFDRNYEERLGNLIASHKKGKKIIFKEEVWFYLLKKK